MGQTLLFYLFSSVLIAGSVGVILGRNPVHAVLFLILVFFNTAGLFLLLGAELLALLLVIVYVGAVAVLFLFIVMMLNINFQELRREVGRYIPMAGIVALLLCAELFFIIQKSDSIIPAVATKNMGTNVHQLGQILYTNYVFAFQISGLILLVAMIGAIVLTLRVRDGKRRQNTETQISRNSAQTLELARVPFRQGVKIP
ncbi:MAG: NADH-quinone oxidoreductase subunit J [Alphaproteobacteria bacterium]